MPLSRPFVLLPWAGRHLGTALVVVAVSTAFLLLTGEIDDTLILLHFVTTGDDIKAVPETLAKLGEAFTKSDWKTLGTLGAPIISRALAIYAFKSACLVVLLSVTVLVLLPVLRRLVLVLGNIPQGDHLEAAGGVRANKSRRDYGQQLRHRAARKRVESFAALILAVLALLVCVAFVGRSEPQFESQTLASNIGDVRDSISDAKQAFSEAIVQASAPAELPASVIDVPSAETAAAASAPAGRRLAAEVTAQQQRIPAAQASPVSSAAVLVQQARLHKAVANDQLSLIERLASQEALMRIIALASAKFGAVLLTLVLVRYMYKQYTASNALVVGYDALADAVELEDVTLPSDLDAAQRALNPLAERSDGGTTAEPPLAAAAARRQQIEDWLKHGTALLRGQSPAG